jgi:ribosomal protein S27AE
MSYKNSEQEEYHRRYREEHRERRREMQRRYREARREELREKQRRYIEEKKNFPEFMERLREQRRVRDRENYAQSGRTPYLREVERAHSAVGRALRNGQLKRPDVCSQCGASGFIEAAHENYLEPLLVRWLCRSCHVLWDKAEPKGAYARTG